MNEVISSWETFGHRKAVIHNQCPFIPTTLIISHLQLQNASP